MSRKIFRSNFLISLLAVIFSLVCILGSLNSYFNSIISANLKDELHIAATATELEGIAFLERTADSRQRLTWVGKEGQVLFDSNSPAEDLDSHLEREEIRQAMAEGRGSSIRYSDTQTERTLYEAVRLSDGSVLRISIQQDSTFGLLLDLLPLTAIVLLITACLAHFFSRKMAQRIVEPLNRIDPENPLAQVADPELAPLLQRLDRQNHQISKQLTELRTRAEEFRLISESMHEGLVLLDGEGQVRSINPAAREYFPDALPEGSFPLSRVDPSGAMEHSFREALEQGHSTVRLNLGKRNCRLDLSRISSDNKILGTVLLAIDITETVNAQKTRREFSANVSHELKSPLQTIMGSAELLENNMVREEDRGRFYSHIRKESRRLLDLIQDIIRLSQLDEGAELRGEEVDLQELCRQVHSDLEKKAAANRISISLQLEPCWIYGIHRLLEEMVYNLCDNAIKYNVPNGTVLLSLRKTSEGAELQVKDSGIGIPHEHHQRIFERFYRVDKSHSRASGGTGLGLSIVKHAAEYHSAPIHLDSVPGKGTTITVTFPTATSDPP